MNYEVKTQERPSGKLIHHSSFIILLAAVRWQIFRNLLRQKRRKIELVATVFLTLLGILIAVSFGLGLGGAVFLNLEKGRTAMLGLALWGIFQMWQVGPLVTEGSSPGLNFREIARYPVSFRVYYLLNTAYGLFDPAALLCLVWLACIWAGTTFARPGWADRAAVLLFCFAVVNLLFNRVFFAFFERVMRTRRGRERLVLVLIGLLAVSQVLIYGVLPGVGKQRVRAVVRSASAAHWVSPPGLVARGITGETGMATPVLGLAAYAAAAALLLRRQLWRTFRGDAPYEAARKTGPVQAQPGWELPWLDNTGAAIFEKEIRYALRDPRTVLGFLSPPLMAVLAVASDRVIRKALTEGLKLDSSQLYPVMLGYALLAVGTLAYNCFCYESRGFRLWQMAPVNIRRVFLAKNTVIAMLLAADFAAVTLVLAAREDMGPARVLTALAGFVYAALTALAAGNLFSVGYPMRVEYGTMSTRKASSVAILFGLLTQFAIIGSMWLVFFFAGRYHLDRLPPVAFTFLILAALKFYLVSLERASESARLRGEEIAADLAA